MSYFHLKQVEFTLCVMKTKVLLVFFILSFYVTTGMGQEGSVDGTDVVAIERTRIEMNGICLLSTNRCGDRYVFDLGLRFVQSDHDVQSGLSFIKSWSSPVDPTGKNRYFRDVAFLYKYFAGLKAGELWKKKMLPEDLENIIIPSEVPSREDFFLSTIRKKNGGTLPTFFDSMNSTVERGKKETLIDNVEKTILLKDGIPIGFLISGDSLRLDFVFAGQKRVNYNNFPDQYPNRILVADFPLPMHTGGGKLIELAIQRGEIVNYLFSGGRRRSGMVVIDRSGKSYPVHIQQVRTGLWTGNWDRALNLSHNYQDLVDFLEMAESERLSVVMGMMLLDNVDGVDLRPISHSSEGGGRRMLVWREQNSGSPALLVLNDGYFANHVTWVAYRLGYKWGIYCDVNYYDNAGYWVEENGSYKRVRFSQFEEQGKLPYYRMILYKEK